MISYLNAIQSSIIKYANIISKILQVEAEIVDENFIRVAGTGVFKNKIIEYTWFRKLLSKWKLLSF